MIPEISRVQLINWSQNLSASSGYEKKLRIGVGRRIGDE
jgi:hypothetical protein